MIRDRLEAAIGEHRLLEHPFYVAWRDGTLPRAAIATYAAEYGTFIAKVPEGWRTAGDHDHAAEEIVHAGMWERFAAVFGAAVGTPGISEVKTLLETSQRLFSDRTTALGALYAFESQQPGTAREKLDGLVTHYGFDGRSPGDEYFRVHADDYHEADEIVSELSEADMDAAVAACGEMAEALWGALDGVLATV